jgi:hypothetical protein
MFSGVVVMHLVLKVELNFREKKSRRTYRTSKFLLTFDDNIKKNFTEIGCEDIASNGGNLILGPMAKSFSVN